MTEEEILEELVLIKAAKKKIYEHAQGYTVGGNQTERADLGKLVARENSLRQELSILQSSGSFGCQTVVFGGRR